MPGRFAVPPIRPPRVVAVVVATLAAVLCAGVAATASDARSGVDRVASPGVAAVFGWSSFGAVDGWSSGVPKLGGAVLPSRARARVATIGNCVGDSIFNVTASDTRSCANEIKTAFRNPDKGWITYDHNPITRTDPATGQTCPATAPETTPLSSMLRSPHITWADLEPSEGVYNWALIDNEIALARSLKTQLNLALGLIDSPKHLCGNESMPQWLRDLIPWGRFTSDNGTNQLPSTIEPKYTDPLFQQKLRDFIAAFASRYYATPAWQANLRSIDINDYGPAGEWHGQFCFSNDAANTYLHPYLPADPNALCQPVATESAAENQNLRTLVDIVLSAFQGHSVKPWLQKDVQGSSKGKNFALYFDPAGDGSYTGDPNPTGDRAIWYAVGAPGFQTQMTRRSVGGGVYQGLSFANDETRFIREHLATQPFIGEWGAFNGQISYIEDRDGTFISVPQQAIDQILNYGITALGWYRVDEIIRCSEFLDANGNLQPWFAAVSGAFPEATGASGCPPPIGTGTATKITVSPLEHHYDPSIRGKEAPRVCLPLDGEILRDYFQRCSGYNFYISESVYPSQVNVGGSFDLKQAWWQRGVAKLYRPYALRAYLVSKSTRIPLNTSTAFDAQNWAPGPSGPHAVISNFSVPSRIKTGTYKLQFAVVGPDGKPAMNLAIDTKDTAGLSDPINDYSYYTIGNIQIR
jgi:hypothetical protein